MCGELRLADPIEEWIAEDRREALIARPSGTAAVEIHETLRIADRQFPQDERVDQREGGRARADGEPEREDCGRRDDRILAEEPQPETKVAPEGLDPGHELHIAARVAQEEAMAELP